MEGGGGGETDRQTETEKSEKSNVIYTERIRTRKLGWFKQFLSMKTYQCHTAFFEFKRISSIRRFLAEDAVKTCYFLYPLTA